MKSRNDTAVVLLSGGQDSTTCLVWALRTFKHVSAVHFRYGQTHIRETGCAQEVASRLDVDLAIKDIATPPAPSSLTGDAQSDKHPLDSKLPSSFVPGRNLILLSYAGVYAYALKAGALVIGASQEDFSGYPDCRADTIEAINKAICLSLDYSLEIERPLQYLSKAETVQLMESMGQLNLYRYTHTCYKGSYPPCGECPSCKLRAKGFAEAGIADPLILKAREEGYNV